MDKSDDIKEISKALAKFHAAVKQPDKSSDSHYGKYVPLEKVAEAVDTASKDTGLSYTQEVTSADGSVGVTTMITHESGQYITLGPLYMPVEAKNAQKFGSAETYARRYALSAAFGITSETDDDGNAASANQPDQSTRPSQHQTRQQKTSEPLASQQDVEELDTLVTDFAGKDGTSPKVVYQNIFTSAKVQNKRLSSLTRPEMGALKRALSQLMG
ncbi:ERF family protein [Lacticaseibacillus mingshuiensis]|uniref:ERF family protein n=1 Tax=Lacticaseibacillus mingshuiensis TaxID=2799574 RepID=UPI0019458391|nr:ERF family protein [Lacticaseibacillus mingshuiensis]